MEIPFFRFYNSVGLAKNIKKVLFGVKNTLVNPKTFSFFGVIFLLQKNVHDGFAVRAEFITSRLVDLVDAKNPNSERKFKFS